MRKQPHAARLPTRFVFAVALLFGLSAAAAAQPPVAALGLALATSSGANARLTTDGSALAKRVAEAIRADHGLVDGGSIVLKVSSNGGNVALAGRVGVIYDRHQTARLAEGVSGVTYVRPSIRIVRGGNLDGTTLANHVRDALAQAGVIAPGFTVRATEDGTVHLNGDVTDKWQAVDVVRKVPGVTAIGEFDARLPGRIPPSPEGTLNVVNIASPRDDVIKGQVEETLRAAGLNALRVESVKGGVVTLLGKAANLRQALNAPAVVQQVPGVLGVTNRTTTNARTFRRGDITVDDDALGRKVRAKLGPLARSIDGLNINIVEGTVYLTGHAGSADAAYSAIDAVFQVRGVREVRSAITYPPPSHDS